MIKHIVMWTLKDKKDAAKLKQDLEDLKGKVSEIIEIEVGINYNPSPAAYDVVLYSVFESKETLDVYQNHPDHVKVKEFVGQIADKRAVVDYEI